MQIDKVNNIQSSNVILNGSIIIDGLNTTISGHLNMNDVTIASNVNPEIDPIKNLLVHIMDKYNLNSYIEASEWIFKRLTTIKQMEDSAVEQISKIHK